FFFFQAEDGIRDKLVTGVQTCALPICPGRAGRHPRLRTQHQRRQSQAPPPHGGRREPVLPGPLPGPEVPVLDPREAVRREGEREIGRASCRERGERWVEAGGVEDTAVR